MSAAAGAGGGAAGAAAAGGSDGSDSASPVRRSLSTDTVEEARVALRRRNTMHRPSHFGIRRPGSEQERSGVPVDTTLILHDPHFNKGTAFPLDERAALKLRGLLPPNVETLQMQRERAMKQFRSFSAPRNRYIFLAGVQARNSTLFFNMLKHHLEELLPVVYTPTVGLACQEFGSIWRVNQGMYLAHTDRGLFREILNSWHEDEVDIIVVTDGSRILGLGDLGTNGMGIPIGKLSLYVAAAGFHPKRCLPITLDAGTNNKQLLADQSYLGTRCERIPDEDYYAMVEEFMVAVNDKFPEVLVQFEDFSNDHCFSLLEKYRERFLCFNDDIQGTGAVVTAGYLGALKASKKEHKDQIIVFYGAGSAGTGIADNMVFVMCKDEGISEEEARKRFYFVDSRGLVTTSRGDKLQDHKVPYARTDVTKEQFDEQKLFSLRGVVETFNPTMLLGVAGVGPAFDEPILRHMAKVNDCPGIFALSNPTSKAECTAEEAYRYTDGKCVFAAGSPFDPVTLNGKTFTPGQGNNMYIFPGLGFGATLAGATQVTDAMITESARALADLVTEDDLAAGLIYPKLANIRDISTSIAARVMLKAREQGFATATFPDKYEDLCPFVADAMYQPEYLPLSTL